MDYRYAESPVGTVVMAGRGEAVAWLGLPQSPDHWHPPAGWRENPRALQEACRQLEAYFAGRRRVFDLDLAPQGTPFQSKVWQVLQTIPYGVTWSYGELARAVGKPTASRAVGAANGRNPIAILIPCHRVIGADGSLTGYGWGTPVKARLLVLEGAMLV